MKQKIKRLWYRTCYLAFRIFFQSRYHKTWCRLYRRLTESSKTKMAIGIRSDQENLAIRSILKWRADSFKELFDAMHSAEYVEWVAHETADKAPGDCDDFAVWNAACAAAQGYHTNILMVGWHDAWRPNGHAIAVRAKHGVVEWCDYGTWKVAYGYLQAARQVKNLYKGTGAVYYCSLDSQLNPRSFQYADS